MSKSPQRAPRFTRSPGAVGTFKLTSRDLEILRYVADHRFIRSNWLACLVGGSKQQILRRLSLLYHHGYLERPRAQIDYYHKEGSQCIVYGLGSRGAGRLRRDLDLPFHRMDWTHRNRSVGRIFLEHTLMISDFMVSLDLECRSNPQVRIIHEDELPRPFGRENDPKPFHWSVDLPGRRRVGVVPDKVLALEILGPADRIERTHVFLEADRGTMPVERRELKQSSIEKKLLCYQSTLASNLHRTRLNAPRFRVLILTTSPQRSETIAKTISKLPRSKHLFHIRLADSAEEIVSKLVRAPQKPGHSRT